MWGVSKAGRNFVFKFYSSAYSADSEVDDFDDSKGISGRWIDDDDEKQAETWAASAIPTVSESNQDFPCKETQRGDKRACQIACKNLRCEEAYSLCKAYDACKGIAFNDPQTMSHTGLWATLKVGGAPLRATEHRRGIGREISASQDPTSRTHCQRVCGSKRDGFVGGPVCLRLPLGTAVYICL